MIIVSYLAIIRFGDIRRKRYQTETQAAARKRGPYGFHGAPGRCNAIS